MDNSSGQYKWPPENLWLVIDLESISFKTKEDIQYIEEVIIEYNPELYTIINNMYKIYCKNPKSCLSVKKPSIKKPPKIMRKIKK